MVTDTETESQIHGVSGVILFIFSEMLGLVI